MIKRIFDLLLSSIGIILVLPILIATSVILRISGEGKVLYFQKRVGLDGEDFFVYKFVTMYEGSESVGSGIYTAKNDSRVLPFGKFLRSSKINELPQLFNVFLGTMSIVGPRPLIRETFMLYNPDQQLIISSLKPGITGAASVIFRDEESILENADGELEEFYKSNITPIKAELEIWYHKNQSLFVDIKIILLTVLSVIFPKSKFAKFIFKGLPHDYNK